MDDIDYVMTGIAGIGIILIFVKGFWDRIENRVKSNQYTVIGISRVNKMWVIGFTMLGIINLYTSRDISDQVFWVGLMLFYIYQCSVKDIILEQGIGQRCILGIKICKIKWEQIESYKRTYRDKIVIEYVNENGKDKKYNMHINEKRIDIFYNKLKEYIREKEIK